MTEKGLEGSFWGDRNVLHETKIWIILVYTFAKTDQTAYLGSVHFSV